jgi:hypothetical protein
VKCEVVVIFGGIWTLGGLERVMSRFFVFLSQVVYFLDFQVASLMIREIVLHVWWWADFSAEWISSLLVYRGLSSPNRFHLRLRVS